MNETMLSQAEFLLAEMENYKKSKNKKIAELNQIILIRNERIEELKEELNNKNRGLANDNNKNIATLQNINKIIEETKSELVQEEENQKQVIKEKENLKQVQQLAYKLEKYIKESKEKYEELLLIKKEYLEKYNSETISSNIKEMYKNKAEIINLQIENMDITINRMLKNCTEKLPKELKKEIEQKIDKENEENAQEETQDFVKELTEEQKSETQQIMQNNEEATIEKQISENKEESEQSEQIEQVNDPLKQEKQKTVKAKTGAFQSLIEKINDKKAQMALGVIAATVLGIYVITNPALAISLLSLCGYREYNKGKKI